jgi:large subunit ribosomal protein L10
MPNQKNKDIVKILKEKIAKAKSVTIVDYLGLSVNAINNFRAKIVEKDAETVIGKNTLIKKAFEEEGVKNEQLDKGLKGPTAVIFSYNDPIEPLKSIYEFAKEMELPKVKLSIIEGVITDSEDTKKISELPTKNVLIAQFIGGLKSPLTGIVNVLGGTQRKFVTVLSRVAEQKK